VRHHATAALSALVSKPHRCKLNGSPEVSSRNWSTRSRGASIYGEILGFGSSNDSHHITAPSRPEPRPRGRCDARLSEAGVVPEAIGYVNAHASSTPLNDVSETRAIKQVFGEHAYRVPISGTKAMHGHATSTTSRGTAGNWRPTTS